MPRKEQLRAVEIPHSFLFKFKTEGYPTGALGSLFCVYCKWRN
ncbi:MAG: DUF3820 family protein [Alistipes sp.]|nr:DUF3820 family protein [Alistipes sp.]